MKLSMCAHYFSKRIRLMSLPSLALKSWRLSSVEVATRNSPLSSKSREVTRASGLWGLKRCEEKDVSELYRDRREAALLVSAAMIRRYLKFFACLVAARQGVVEVVVWPLLVISWYGLAR